MVEKIFNILVDNFGWANTVHLKDFVTFLAGAIASALVLLLLLARMFVQIKKVSTEIHFLKVEYKGKTLFVANPQTFLESLEVLLLVFRYRFSRRKTIKIKVGDKKDHKGQKLLSIILFVIFFSLVVGVVLVLYQIPQP